MYKVVWFVRFPGDADVQERMLQWRDVHGPLFARVPGIQCYMQNHVLGSLVLDGVGEGATAFQGYTAAWWQDEASFLEAARSSEWQAVLADAQRLFDVDWMFDGWTTEIEERVKKAVPDEWLGQGGQGSVFKVVWVARFAPGLERAEARDHWTNVHGEIALETEEIGKAGAYVQNHAIRALDENGEQKDVPLGFNGFSECWFEDRLAYDRAMGSEPWARLAEDGYQLFDMDELFSGMSAYLREYRFI